MTRTGRAARFGGVTEIVEKRRHPRVAADFAINVNPPNTAIVQDISRAGVRCTSQIPLPPMTIVALRLEISSPTRDGSPTEIVCQGVVVRNQVIEHPDGPMFEAAIVFQDLSPEAEVAIDRFVADRLISPTG